MRDKTTLAQLDRLVTRLNELTGNPTRQWAIGEWDEATQSVRVRANLGNYHIHKGNGGYRVEQIDTLTGGVHQPFGSDIYTARELAIQLRAVIDGLNLNK